MNTLLRFIGTEGSMGLHLGHVYPVRLLSGRGSQDSLVAAIEICDGGTRFCPYSSSAAFFLNWETTNSQLD